MELGLLTYSVCLACIALWLALRDGWLSPQNTRYAINAGVIGYALFRPLSLLPILKSFAVYKKFLFIALLGATGFHFYIIWINARS
jgi:hypothetical protein